MKNGMKLKALLLGFSICAASGAVATTAMPANEAPATVTSAYADRTTGTDSATEAGAETTAKDVASVADKTYATLQEAINAAETGATVKLLANTNANVTVAKAQNLTLDLNGFTLNGGTVAKSPALLNYGSIKITDSSEAKKGTIKRDDNATGGYYVILNFGGTMTIEQAIVYNNSGYKNTSSSWNGSSLICNGDSDDNSTLTINGGSFEQQNFIAVKVGANGYFTMNGGSITSKQSAVQNWCSANIQGGELNGTLWTDCYVYGESEGKTTFGGDAVLNGEVHIEQTKHGSDPTPVPELTITGGTMNITLWAPLADDFKITVTGGSFSSQYSAIIEEVKKYTADGCELEENSNGTYQAIQYYAQIGETKYTSFSEAIEAAEAGDTVYLLNNVSDFAGVIVQKDLTVNFGKYTVTGATGATVFKVSKANVHFTATADGGINGGSGGDNNAICAMDGANVTISGGNYTVGGDANGEGNSTVYVTGTGKVNITGGTFSSEKAYHGKYYVLNLNNKSTGTITVSGGTFINYNPAKGDDNLGGNFVAEDYVAYESEENTYTVAETVIKQSQAALGSDITMKFFLSSDKYTVSVTLNKNGSEEITELESSGTTENGLYIYSFTGLTPQMINRSFTVNVYNGNVLRDSYTYSVLEYCNYLLAQTSTTEKTKTLIAELLNYGKAAQEYLGADSAELTEAIKNAGLTTGSTIDSEAAITNSGKEIIVSGATLNFSHDNKVVFVIAKDMYAKLGGYTVTVNGTKITADEWIASGDYYMWYSEGILATAFDKDYTMLISDAKTNEKLQELTISVNAYCATANKLDGASEKLKNLVIATYNYGKAAKAYAAK